MGNESNNPVESGTANDDALTVDDAVQAFADFKDDLPDEEETGNEATDEEGAEDAAEDEQDDQEPDPEEDQGDDDDAEDQPAGEYAGDDVQVQMPDGTITTVADLKSGNLMQADYTRKTQELSHERQETAQIRQHSIEWGNHFAHQSQAFEQGIQAAMQFIPDPSIKSYDPVGYSDQLEQAFEQFQAVVMGAQETQQQAQGYSTEQQQAMHAQAVQREMDALTSKHPELLDETKRQAYFQSNAVALRDHYGFSLEEINGVMDHRMFQVADDARKWREHVASQQAERTKAKQKVKTVPPVGTSKRSRTSGERKRGRATQANARLRKTGHVNDATAALMDLDD